MGRLLAPGMRLMRRFGVSAKLGVVAALLVVPLAISLVGGLADAEGMVRATADEQLGLGLAGPLVRLDAQVALARAAALDGRDLAPTALDAVAEIEASPALLDPRFALRDRWRDLTALLDRLVDPAVPASERARTGTQAATAIAVMLEELGERSSLILDPELPSYSLVVVLLQDLPATLDAAARAQALHRTVDPGTSGPGVGVPDGQLAARRSVLEESVAGGARRLEKVVREPGSEQAARAFDGPSATLRTQATLLAQRTGTTHGGAPHPEPSLDVLAGAVSDLSAAVETELGRLLEQRHAQLRRSQLVPVALSLGALAAAAYLVLAALRATSRDVSAVLGEIVAVTDGGIQSSDPLPGPDEFGQMSRAVVVARDRLTAAVGELSFLARHDQLTSLPNQLLATEKLTEFLEAQRRRTADGPDGAGQGTVAVALLDLRGHKDVNDSFGPEIADQVVLAATRRLHRATRRRDVVARLGAQHFAVVLPDVAGAAEVVALLEEVVTILEQPAPVGGRRLRVRAVAGVALAPDDAAVGAGRLWRDAEVAKSAAREGSRRVAVFVPAMRDRHTERVELSADLALAIEQGELAVWYQPVVDLGTRRITGAEALVRWVHPSRGIIGPDVFIPLAEATGLIEPIGRWVLREAATELARWTRDHPAARTLRMDVNVAAAQLAGDELVEDLVAVLEETGLAPERIVLELTESALMADAVTATRRLRRLASLGVRIALDDFGTGYSSLSYLSRLPVDILKIDKEFVPSGAADDRSPDVPVLRTIVALARALGLETIAEGVETPSQEGLLREFGCDQGQGWLYGRPMPGPDLAALLAAEGTTAVTLPQQRG